MARKVKDRTGDTYGRLTAIRQNGRASDGAVLWLCRCECGKEVTTRGDSLAAGSVKSCGCLIADTRHRPDPVDRAGQRYGRLVAVEPTSDRDASGTVVWRCMCDCGREKLVPGKNLTGGNTKSCGCLQADNVYKTHGMSSSPEYRAWKAMKTRCLDPNNPRWLDYGGRGIMVCDRWLESFQNFFADVGLRPGDGYSLDRINNDSDYKPSNVKWSTDAEQRLNQRPNVRNSQLRILQERADQAEAEAAALRAEVERLRASA